MIGGTGVGLRRRTDRLGEETGAAGLGLAPTEGGFSVEMATAVRPAGARAEGTASQKTCDLAAAGGGSARIELSLGRGEPAELQVSVRGRLVTVVARVATASGERAIAGSADAIARSLAAAGLALGRLIIRRDLRPEAGTAARKDRPPERGRSRRHDEEENEP